MSRLTLLKGSLLARIVVGYVLIAAVFAAAWLWSLYGPLTQAALTQQERNLTAVAQAAALVSAQSDKTPDEIARQLVSRTDLRLTIVESDGTVIADSGFDASKMENHGDRAEVAEALAGRIGISRRLSRTQGQDELYVAVPASYLGRRIALRVSQPLAEIQAIASRSRRIGLLLLAGALVVGLGIAISTTRQATRPIRDLSTAAERMAEGDLGVEIPTVPTDLETLAHALTSLRGQVKTRLAALEAEQVTLRTTLDGLTDAVLLLDGETIKFANEAASRLLRKPSAGWQNTPLAQAALPSGVRAIVMEQDAQHRASVRDTKPDPTGRVLRVTIVPLAQDTPLGRTIVTIGDITELSRLDKVRRDFVANASHELKTPTAGIRLLAQSVEMAAGDGDICRVRCGVNVMCLGRREVLDEFQALALGS
jgi:two-component system phosphate regulon sensor histidine kinase PhoR